MIEVIQLKISLLTK